MLLTPRLGPDQLPGWHVLDPRPPGLPGTVPEHQLETQVDRRVSLAHRPHGLRAQGRFSLARV